MRKSMLSGGSTPRGGGGKGLLPAKCNRTHLAGGPGFGEKIELKGGEQEKDGESMRGGGEGKFEDALLFSTAS